MLSQPYNDHEHLLFVDEKEDALSIRSPQILQFLNASVESLFGAVCDVIPNCCYS